MAKRIVPRSFLLKNEFFFRKLISLKYKGDTHQCNICEFSLNRFVKLDDTDLLCPRCGSRSRTRRLYNLLIENKVLNGKVLHFSPPRSLYEKFKTQQGIHYFSSDFENQFVADYNYDITSIACEANTFDLIICYHILEHIDADTKAMSELYRVLKPSGLCYIQTPFKDGDIYEDYSISSEEGRKSAFGQEDHLRIYSVDGLRNRLKTIGFNVEIKTFKKNDLDEFGLKAETVLLVKK